MTKEKEENIQDGFIIPKQFRNRDFRFILLGDRNNIRSKTDKIYLKQPIEKNWQDKANYPYNSSKLKKAIDDGHNYGILGGYGDLLILDFDNMDFYERYRPLLPDTLECVSGSGKRHMYYICKNATSVKLQGLLDVQFKKTQVVGPGCLHNSGNIYKLLNPESEITEIGFSNILNTIPELAEYIDNQGLSKDGKYKHSEIETAIMEKIPLDVLIEEYGYKKVPGLTQKCLLGHESKGKKSFNYNTDGFWFCFSCGKKGGIIKFLMDHKNITEHDAIVELMNRAGLNQIDPELFIAIKKKQNEKVAAIISDKILSKYFFKIIVNDDKREIWYYDEGVYKENGVNRIIELTKDMTKDKYTKKIADRVIANIEAKNSHDITSTEYVEGLKTTSEEFYDNRDTIYEIPVQNGILNIQTRKLTPFTPKKIFFNKLSMNYNAERSIKDIQKFLESILPETDIKIIQEWFGYCLLKDYPYQKALMLLGVGSNGKGVLMQLLKNFLSDKNYSSIKLQDIETKDFTTYCLHNKLANISDETSAKTVNEMESFKSLTGEGTIQANRKFKAMVNFKNYAKIINSCNKLPRIKDSETADAFF